MAHESQTNARQRMPQHTVLYVDRLQTFRQKAKSNVKTYLMQRMSLKTSQHISSMLHANIVSAAPRMTDQTSDIEAHLKCEMGSQRECQWLGITLSEVILLCLFLSPMKFSYPSLVLRYLATCLTQLRICSIRCNGCMGMLQLPSGPCLGSSFCAWCSLSSKFFVFVQHSCLERCASRVTVEVVTLFG